MDDEQSLRDSFEWLAASQGPFEVVLVTAPEPFAPEPGVRAVHDGSEIIFAVSSLRADTTTDDDGLTHIGEISLVLNRQVATALHSFLTVLLDQASAPHRPSGTLLPMAQFVPRLPEDKSP